MEKINKIVNAIYHLIPDCCLNITGTDLYIEGGISSQFKIKANKSMSVPMDVSIQEWNNTSNLTNLAVFKDDSPKDYEFKLFITEYIFALGLDIIYNENLLDGTFNLTTAMHLPKNITTTYLNKLPLDFAMYKNGFGENQPC